MKYQLATLLIIATLPAFSQSPEDVSLAFKKVEWVIGTWDRTNIKKPGRTSSEQWEKISPLHLRGTGISMQDQDTVFVEKISIVIKDNLLYYVADVPENKEPVYFKFTEITNTGFVCENPQHDFPKKITYQVEGPYMKAQISGDGQAIDYVFKKR